ncbi:hypothetical protein AADZ90_003130 [Aestuariibius sp. 2305UL40-4]|uniref:hypothetical protein n=1 Tax=Aestuariibius violaceus TaxID=3234132 RepID=UPI003476F839
MRPTVFDFATHSLSLISRNWVEMLRISAVRVLIYIVAVVALEVALWSSPLFDGSRAVFYVGLTVCIEMVFIAWLAVPWHRYVLLSERQGWRASIPGRATLSYALWAVLLIAGAFLPVIALAPFGWLGGGFPFVVGILAFGLVLFGLYVGFRLSLVLPSIAVGRPLRLAEVWSLTGPHRAVIAGVLALIIGVYLLVGWVGILLESLHPALIVAATPLSWLSLLFDVSVLTTLYGHIVEDRPLT